MLVQGLFPLIAAGIGALALLSIRNPPLYLSLIKKLAPYFIIGCFAALGYQLGVSDGISVGANAAFEVDNQELRREMNQKAQDHNSGSMLTLVVLASIITVFIVLTSVAMDD